MKINKTIIIILLISSMLLSIVSAEIWTQYQNNYQKTGFFTNTEPTNMSVIHATFGTGGSTSGAVIDENYVYIGLGSAFYKLDKNNISNQIANYSTGGTIDATGILTDDYIYFCSDDANCYQLNKTTFSQVANYSTGGAITGSPLIADGYFFVVSDDYYLYKLNASDISQLHSTEKYSLDYPRGSIAYDNGYIYFGTNSDRLLKYSTSDITAPTYTYLTGGNIASSPAISNGYVYIGSQDDKLYQLNSTTLSFIASYTTGANVAQQSGIAIGNGYVYVGSDDSYLYQLDANNVSNLIASHYLGGIVRSTPIITSNYVYVGGNDGIIYKLDANNVSGVMDSAPVVVDGYLYLLVSDVFYQLGEPIVECVVDGDCGLCEECINFTCVNQSDGEDTKNECVTTFGCFNDYTLNSSGDGGCDGFGSCDTTYSENNVSVGNVCINGSDVDPTSVVYCGVWNDCLDGETFALSYFVGYLGDGTTTCYDTGWVASGGNYSVPVGYLINFTEKTPSNCSSELISSFVGYVPVFDDGDVVPIFFDGFGKILVTFISFAGVIALVILWRGYKKKK